MMPGRSDSGLPANSRARLKISVSVLLTRRVPWTFGCMITTFCPASTCPRCAVFSPKFVEYYNEHFAGRNDLQVVVWSTERPKSNILKYMRDHQMPFATLNDDDAGMVVYAFRKQGVIVNIPGFIVIDRFGRELYSTGGTGEAQTIPTAEASLEKIAALLP